MEGKYSGFHTDQARFDASLPKEIRMEKQVVEVKKSATTCKKSSQELLMKAADDIANNRGLELISGSLVLDEITAKLLSNELRAELLEYVPNKADNGQLSITHVLELESDAKNGTESNKVLEDNDAITAASAEGLQTDKAGDDGEDCSSENSYDKYDEADVSKRPYYGRKGFILITDGINTDIREHFYEDDDENDLMSNSISGENDSTIEEIEESSHDSSDTENVEYESANSTADRERYTDETESLVWLDEENPILKKVNSMLKSERDLMANVRRNVELDHCYSKRSVQQRKGQLKRQRTEIEVESAKKKRVNLEYAQQKHANEKEERTQTTTAKSKADAHIVEEDSSIKVEPAKEVQPEGTPKKLGTATLTKTPSSLGLEFLEAMHKRQTEELEELRKHIELAKMLSAKKAAKQ